jgi:GT2 family glycosyltransferase
VTHHRDSRQGIPRVLVAILDWETPDLAIKAARSALLSRGVQSTVALVDNGCAIDHTPVFRTEFQATDVSVSRNDENLGFAGGINKVLESTDISAFDGIALLNSDSVLDPEALRTLVAELQDPVVAAVAPAVWVAKDGDDELEGFGGTIDWRRGRPTVVSRGVRRKEGSLPTAHDAEWLTGACLVLQPDALRDVGLLDIRYFMYFEETDWCVRATRRGWRLRNCPAAALSHVGSASSDCPTKLYWLLRNNVLFMRKLAPRRFLLPFLAYWWIVQMPNLARWCLSRPLPTASAILRAALWHVRRPLIAQSQHLALSRFELNRDLEVYTIPGDMDQA